MKKKIIGFGASTSTTSINKAFAAYALTFFPEFEVELVDLNDFAVPVFSVDLEKEHFPETAKAFLAKIAETDIIICSMSEHNRNWTAAFKSLFDWCSRINLELLQQKPILLMSTSPGGYGAQNSLNIALKVFPQFGGNILESFALPKFYDNFDPAQGIKDEALLAEFKKQVSNFKNKLNEVN